MTPDHTPHEFDEHDPARERRARRSFGLLFTVVFLLVGLWPLLRMAPPRWWAVALSVLCLVLALAWPAGLAPFNAAWMRLGAILHRIVSPLVLGMLFYLTVVPTGLVMRALGKDPLRLRFDRAAPSYWIERQPPGPAPDSLRNQF
jgi:hypothetical protein